MDIDKINSELNYQIRKDILHITYIISEITLIIFITLKLANILKMSWFQTTSPLWIQLILVAANVLFYKFNNK